MAGISQMSADKRQVDMKLLIIFNICCLYTIRIQALWRKDLLFTRPATVKSGDPLQTPPLTRGNVFVWLLSPFERTFKLHHLRNLKKIKGFLNNHGSNSFYLPRIRSIPAIWPYLWKCVGESSVSNVQLVAFVLISRKERGN